MLLWFVRLSSLTVALFFVNLKIIDYTVHAYYQYNMIIISINKLTKS